jgi:sulfatase maturation enzyme AslB (radical SAM superfamily)
MLAKFKNDIPLIEWNSDVPEQLWFLDLKLGNICNLKCRICGSWSSSKWAQEELDYYPLATADERKKHSAYVWLRQGQWPRESTEFWNNINQVLPGVRYYEFTGGEPFLIQEHFDLLQRTVDQGYAHLVDVHYNTNGTQYPEAAVEMWEKFKHVNIAFSIDDLGARFEYQRYGAKWDAVSNNLDRFLELQKTNPKITLQMCITANIQNILYLPDVMNYVWEKGFRDVYINMLHDPFYLNIKQMTPAAIELVSTRLEQVLPTHKFYRDFQQLLAVIKTGPGSDGQEFCKTIKQGDLYRKQSFTDHHPEIAKAMGYE